MRPLEAEEKRAMLTGLFYKSWIAKEFLKQAGVDLGDIKIEEDPENISFSGLDNDIAQKIFGNKIFVED